MMDYTGQPTGNQNLPQLPSGAASNMFTNLVAQQQPQQQAAQQGTINNMQRSNGSGGAVLAQLAGQQSQAGQQNMQAGTQSQVGAAQTANANTMNANTINFKNQQGQLQNLLDQQRIRQQLLLQQQDQNFTQNQAMTDRAYNVAGSDMGAIVGGESALNDQQLAAKRGY